MQSALTSDALCFGELLEMLDEAPAAFPLNVKKY